MEKGVPIRSISRFIAVLQAINRAGDLSLIEISRRAKVPYPTAVRIVQTLMVENLIEREPVKKHYRPTPLVRTLSDRIYRDHNLIAVSRLHIVRLTKMHGWPISLATRVGQSMVIRDSTHTMVSRTFNNYFPGYTLPVLESASGRAYFAFSEASERALIAEDIRAGGGEWDEPTLCSLVSGDLFNEIRNSGYALRAHNAFTETPGKTSSIARPIFGSKGVVASLVLIFFSSTMKTDTAVSKYDNDLRNTANLISEALIEVETNGPNGAGSYELKKR